MDNYLDKVPLNNLELDLSQTFTEELNSAYNLLPEAMKTSQEVVIIKEHLMTTVDSIQQLVSNMQAINPSDDPVTLINKTISAIRMMLKPGVTNSSGPSTNMIINSTINILVKNTPKPINKEKQPKAKRSTNKAKIIVNKPPINSRTSSANYNDVFNGVPKEAAQITKDVDDSNRGSVDDVTSDLKATSLSAQNQDSHYGVDNILNSEDEGEILQ